MLFFLLQSCGNDITDLFTVPLNLGKVFPHTDTDIKGCAQVKLLIEFFQALQIHAGKQPYRQRFHTV